MTRISSRYYLLVCLLMYTNFRFAVYAVESSTDSSSTSLSPDPTSSNSAVDTSTSTPSTPITFTPSTPTIAPTTTSTITPTTTSKTTPTTTTPTTTTTPPPHQITTSFIWTESECLEYPEVVVTVDEGYSISVNVSDVELPAGSYLFIEAGDKHVPGATEGRVFANNVKGPLLYLFPNNHVYTKCKANSTAKFTIEYKKAGEPTTTTSTTTTTENTWPTTQKTDTAFITVNVSGRHVQEYNKSEVVRNFQYCVAKMAEQYCKNENIVLLKTITEENVQIRNIIPCPFSWPDSENCVRITFKLPVFYDSAKWEGYQLNSKHLGIMWLRYSNSECFQENHFSDYTEPNFDKAITWWAVGISVVIALFIILLWFLRTFSSQLKSKFEKRYRKTSDTSTIISSKKDSLISLTPHYLQDHMDTPKFFET